VSYESSGGAANPQTLKNQGKHAVNWQWGTQSLPGFQWSLTGGSTWTSTNSPFDQDLASGKTDTLDVRMSCPTTTTTYTITLFEEDKVTHQSVTTTIALVVPGTKG
jgi:hypothetical protein